MSLAVLLLASGLLGASSPDSAATAVFAGGSFWCLEPVFEKLPGVDSARSGYAGPPGAAPTFDQVTSGMTGYLEAVEVFYHPRRIGYPALLDAFWKNIDPTRADGQFTDEGPEYRTAIYYATPAEERAAEASRKRLEKSKRFPKPLATQILPVPAFYPAEAAQQDYYKKNPSRYHAYYMFSGREEFLKKAWGAKAKTAKQPPR